VVQRLYNYVYDAVTHVPDVVRPNGYPFFIDLLLPLHSATRWPSCRRRWASPWASSSTPCCAARAALVGGDAGRAAGLFDSYQLHLEHMITADTLFIFLGIVAIVILCWNDRPSVPVMAVAGLLIGYATLVRSVGQPLLVVVLVAMLVRRVGWRRLVTLLVAGVVPIAAYMIWFNSCPRPVRADRVLGHVPVQPGQHVRPVRQDQPAGRRPRPV
jgi:hypothetical protein